jgi:hypothetical protein
MEIDNHSQIVYAERVGNGVLVEFEDGKSGFYSGSFLRENLPSATEIDISEDELPEI